MPTVSPKQYAKQHGISFSTVYKKIRSGELPFVTETMEVKRIPVDENGDVVKDK